MNNAQISNVFETVADLLEFQGANSFRVRAYRNAARTIHDLEQQISSIVADPNRKLTEISGIGADLADKIATLVETGKLPMLVELQAEVPESVMTLLRIPGLGPKKAATLFKELKVTTLQELREACDKHLVRELKGFGAKTEETIIAGLSLAETASLRMYWAEADVVVQTVLSYIKQCPAVQQVEAAGSYRRGKDTVGDLDMLVVATDVNRVMDHFGKFPGVSGLLGRGETKMSIRLESGLQVDLRIVPTESFGAALQYFTGSKEHNVILRGLAKNQGLKINEYGVYRGEQSIAGRSEAEVYATLNLPPFPPEMREGRREFDWAAKGELPKLVQLSDIAGDLHMHTTESDGKNSLAEMVAAAQARGLKFIAITDHSKRVSMARGLDGARLRQQWREIDAINQRLDGFLVLKGVECDILERGGMDLPDDVLAEADWVVASVHYGQKQPREQITDRIVGAMENPHVAAIAHPTGRILNRRAAYEVDLEIVYRVAREQGKLLELNSNPARLDLDDVACAAAKRHGIPIVINSDAHNTAGLGVLRYGILQARRAGLTAADVANTRDWPAMKALIGRKA